MLTGSVLCVYLIQLHSVNVVQFIWRVTTVKRSKWFRCSPACYYHWIEDLDGSAGYIGVLLRQMVVQKRSSEQIVRGCRQVKIGFIVVGLLDRIGWRTCHISHRYNT